MIVELSLRELDEEMQAIGAMIASKRFEIIRAERRIAELQKEIRSRLLKAVGTTE